MIAAWLRRARALVPPAVRGLALVHLGALGVIGLAIAVERAAAGASMDAAAGRQAVVLWARLAPALTLLGAALAWARTAAVRLALGSFGLREPAMRAATLPLGVVIAGLALAVPSDGAPSAWVRGAGGWYHLGVALPDTLGGVVTPLPARWAWSTAAACVLAGPAGARAWRPAPLAAVAIAAVLADAVLPWGGAALLLLAAVPRYSQVRRGAV